MAFTEVNAMLAARRRDWPTLLILDCLLPGDDLHTSPEWGVLVSASSGAETGLTSRLTELLRSGIPGGQPEISLQEACRSLAQAAPGDLLYCGARIGALVLAPNPAVAPSEGPARASAARDVPVQTSPPTGAGRRQRRTGWTAGLVAVVIFAVAVGTAVGLLRRTGGDAGAGASASPGATTGSPAVPAEEPPTNHSRLGLRLATTLAAPTQVGQMLFSPDGKTLAVAYESLNSPSTAIQLWDIASGTKRLTLTAPWSTPMACSPDSRTIATGGDTIQLWDAATGTMTRQFRSQAVDGYGPIAFSPDGKTLAAAALVSSAPGNYESEIQIWNLSTSLITAVFPVPSSSLGRLSSLVFSHDGTMLAAGGQGDAGQLYAYGSVLLWNVSTHQLIGASPRPTPPPGSLGSNVTVSSIAFSRDDRTLAVATEVAAASIVYEGVRLWTFATGKETLLTADGGGWLAYNPAGTVLATENADGANVRFWDTRTRRLITTLNFPSTPTGAVPLDVNSTLAFSPDGRKFAVPDGNSTQVWDLGAG